MQRYHLVITYLAACMVMLQCVTGAAVIPGTVHIGLKPRTGKDGEYQNTPARIILDRLEPSLDRFAKMTEDKKEKFQSGLEQIARLFEDETGIVQPNDEDNLYYLLSNLDHAYFQTFHQDRRDQLVKLILRSF
ncbi:hypothetical protein FRC03_008195 [Tulasnella sp. 419]|nr:hypothetical protein FRC03_008195 [Tulasnella sp. 419]